MTMFDQKGLEQAIEAAKYHLEIDGDNEGQFIRFDSIEAGVEAAITAYLSTTTPTDVGGLVERLNGENSDKVTATDRLRLFAHDPGTFEFDQHDALSLIATIEEAATALAAKDAELAEALAEIDRLKNLVGDPEGTPAHAEAFLDRAERAEAQLAEARKALENEEKRSVELLLRLDKARSGNEPDFCYDPDEWEFTCSWDERDQVHGYGDGLPLGAIMQVATLIRGPRKWVAHVPVTWNGDGDPEDTRIEWFDSEDSARHAFEAQGGENVA